ncbi:methylmalonyl-CoA mutase [Thermotomaculum hydrothermale]|uniref:Fused isobutyryl-CoA mutase n=1 Tax=Thermotomaculum hydrothermale TaxID=981385 RepID=A0A7R6PGM1_9BACT|nr:methylmalonyl-CoA mutase family protein [Thermotomaculum hydrothermale]BBB32244.1 methylmalonyl-CoA mutase [Thermotomaculum hydrothermale]
MVKKQKANKVKARFVTAASLYDGHDVSINIMRRILQAKGAEVVHLGHNRSVDEIVDTAIEEDVHAIAVSSYQGGHMEYFKYARDRFNEEGMDYVRIFGGGGGVIVPEEIKELEEYGITKIFSPEDGKKMGLEGMIEYMLEKCNFSLTEEYKDLNKFKKLLEKVKEGDKKAIARAISVVEEAVLDGEVEKYDSLIKEMLDRKIPVLGVTGTGGAGKSSLLDETIRRFLDREPDKRIAVISIDPTKRKSGGALLGDRIRMNSLPHPRAYMRSLATRGSNKSTSEAVSHAVDLLKLAGFDLVIVETSGIGQSDTEVVDVSDVHVYVMTSDYGAATQLEKIDMIDFADAIVLNKFDRRGSEDALRDIRKQYRRAHLLWDAKDEELPVFPTVASKFNDKGVNTFFNHLMNILNEKTGSSFKVEKPLKFEYPEKNYIIPPERIRYLSEISDEIAKYDSMVEEQSNYASRLYGLIKTKETLTNPSYFDTSGSIKNFNVKDGKSEVELGRYKADKKVLEEIDRAIDALKRRINPEYLKELEEWEDFKNLYRQEKLVTKVRDKEIVNELFTESLSGTKIPKISLPKYKDWGDILKWKLRENVPGMFPFTAGVFPFKRKGEDPTRMFAGEGTPERTNKRFHYLSQGQPAARLSTAFDSVTLYGYDPDTRPDIYGKIGNSGVSIATIDDMKKLYCGFDLCDPKTSVSMTINGPAPMMLAMFFNTAIDQQVEKYLRDTGKIKEAEKIKERYFKERGVRPPEYRGKDNPQGDRAFGLFTLGIPGYELVDRETYEKIKDCTLNVVRGTVQADILKEDQAQNTCIFSTEFALKMMGDIQEYFIEKNVRNYYSVSISGYHIAEAGANPITQLAFTLANGFTYVEYYLSRGMDINDFARNFSFFFSNGLDPEYSVIGRVARRIWAIAMKYKYGANERSQKLKYHIQTSGRSLHAQEIDFNDIRTTLQALIAIYDNCNSLHTNAYDEAITTPTEESVRRALAIQLIINKEFGMTKNENPLQGSFIIEELTDLVQEAVLMEFRRISERGGVLGAMETMYQRGKIQEESMYYEYMKHTGKLPIIGVNTFERPPHLKGLEKQPLELIRSTEEEKKQQIENLKLFHERNKKEAPEYLKRIRQAAINNENTFKVLMDAVNYCSLGQITQELFSVGGQYRRNM